MAIIGEPINANLTSWAANSDTSSLPYYLSTYNSFHAIAWMAKGATLDTSVFGTTYPFTTDAASMLSIEFTLEAHLKTPQDGYLGLVTFSGGEVLNLNDWTAVISRPVHPVPVFGTQYMSYAPGLTSVAGTMAGFIDDTTAVKRPLLVAGWGNATFQVLTGGTGKQIVAPINYTQTKSDTKRGAPATKNYDWKASGAVTTVGSSTNMLWAADATGALLSDLNMALGSGPAGPATILLTTNGSLALGGAAYWKQITVTCKLGSAVKVQVEGCFSGTPSTLTAMGS